MFKFSIITSTYNRLDNLKLLYSSIIKNKNNLFDIEWVLVVEEKDIETIKFLKSILKKKIIIKIIKNNYPLNFSKLIKQGIKNSTGDYLIILGDDDIIYKNSLIKIYNFIKKNSSSWIISPVHYHDEYYKKIRKIITKIKEILILLNYHILLKILNYYMTPGVIISRNLMLKVNHFPDNWGTSNDWITWLNIANLEKPDVINNYYFSVGYNSNTISGSLNFEKYYYLYDVKNLRKNNLIIRLLTFLSVTIIFLSNFILKNIHFLINILKKPNIINEKKIIFHLTRNFKINHQTGGIEQFILQLKKNFRYDQKIITYIFYKGKDNKKINYEKNNIFYFKKLSFFNDYFSFDLLKFLIKESLNYKIIHLHHPHPFSFLYILLLPFKKKIILTYHSDILRYSYIKWIVWILFILVKKNINIIHFSSEIYKEASDFKKVKNYFIESFSIKKQTIKIKNIPIYFIKNLPEKYTLFIGRDRHYKGFDKLKKIILSNMHINFVCVTNYKFDFKSQNLRIFANISEEKKLYLIKNSYLHINTSDNRAESFGFSILESLSFGVPVIVFKMSSGTNFLIKNNFNGFIIDNFDTNLFIKRINDLYSNYKLYKNFRRNTFLDYKKRLSHNYEILDKKYKELLNL